MAFAERGRDGDVRDRRNVPARALIPLDVPALADLRQKRLHDCRLTPDRALQTLEEAEAFLVDRGVLTLTQDSALPSLFAASHEEPYKKGSPGFGSWPKTKYVWAFQLTERPGVLSLKVHRGKQLLCHQAATRAIDPLARGPDRVGKELQVLPSGKGREELRRLDDRADPADHLRQVV